MPASWSTSDICFIRSGNWTKTSMRSSLGVSLMRCTRWAILVPCTRISSSSAGTLLDDVGGFLRLLGGLDEGGAARDALRAEGLGLDDGAEPRGALAPGNSALGVGGVPPEAVEAPEVAARGQQAALSLGLADVAATLALATLCGRARLGGAHQARARDRPLRPSAADLGRCGRTGASGPGPVSSSVSLRSSSEDRAPPRGCAPTLGARSSAVSFFFSPSEGVPVVFLATDAGVARRISRQRRTLSGAGRGWRRG